eukprot:s872_g3.t1
MSQPLRRYSLAGASPSREPSKEPPIPERDSRRTATPLRVAAANTGHGRSQGQGDPNAMTATDRSEYLRGAALEKSGQFNQVLGSLDAESLLEVPMTCRDIQLLVRGLEDSLWKEILKETDFSRLPEGAEPSASELVPKLQYRLCRYLCQRGLPSLHDALRCAADYGHEAVLELLLHDQNFLPLNTGCLAAMARVSAFKTGLYVLALLVCGSLNTLTMKIAFTMSGTVDGQTQRFEKPWFITFVMFAAMCLALPCDSSMWKCQRSKMATEPLLSPTVLMSRDAVQMTWRQKVVRVIAPAFFDIGATGLCCVGFLYIPASVWQLLRGAEIVFAAIFSVFCLGRHLYCFHWIALLLCVLGIVSVGLASVWGDEAQASAKGAESAVSLQILGIGLALAGQVVQAAQVIAEEWLLKDVDLPGLQVVGFEGIWGALLMPGGLSGGRAVAMT